jgi:acetyltransferase-like isoleucine patch superfamily enzyme
VVIEDDVWIGYNARILKGVRVGEGRVIEAGAVVLHDVPAGSIVAGNPARIIGQAQP